MQQNANHQVYLKSRPAGIPQAENFSLRETEVPRLEEGEILIRNHYLSADPWPDSEASRLPHRWNYQRAG
jgi:NADPH-dependent curcumin reductase CurA